ncbi:MAG: pilin [Giesbergeria sp.]
MTAAATAFNTTLKAQKQSKYVDDIVIKAGSPWDITVAVSAANNNGIPTTLNAKTIRFAPNVAKAIPTAASVGAIDWACTSATDATAKARTLANRPLGTLPAKYAPSECR